MAAPGTAHFKRPLAAIVAAGILVLGLAAYAQQNKLPRVGVLSNTPLTSAHYEAFRQALRDLGYVEGKNITFIPKSAQGNTDLFPELARELARANVNVMVVAGDQGLRAAKEATDEIPIIVLACDPLDSLVASIARPVLAGGRYLPSLQANDSQRVSKARLMALSINDCELVHTLCAVSRPIRGVGSNDMTEPATRTSWWPTADLMLIVISAIIIGIGFWIMVPL